MLTIEAESILFTGTAASSLGHANIIPGTLTLRAQHPNGTNYGGGNVVIPNVTYVEGVDYTVDYTNGTITRTSGSGIPNFPTSPNPSSSPGSYIVWATYTTTNDPHVSITKSSALPRLATKLRAGSAISVLGVGDSITAGGEVEKTADVYLRRWFSRLTTRFGSTVNYTDHTLPGTTALWLLSNSATPYAGQYEAIFDASYDLVIIAYGMNDQYAAAQGDGSEFKSRVLYALDRYRTSYPNSEFILVTTVEGNPTYTYPANGPSIMRTRLNEIAAARSGVYVADVLSHWDAYLTRKGGTGTVSGRSMFRNDINHPTSFGHWIWSLPFEAVEPGVARSWALPYNVTGTPTSAARSWSLPFAIKNAVGRSWSIPYTLRGIVSRSWSLPYGIGAAGVFYTRRTLIPFQSASFQTRRRLVQSNTTRIVVDTYVTSAQFGVRSVTFTEGATSTASSKFGAKTVSSDTFGDRTTYVHPDSVISS